MENGSVSLDALNAEGAGTPLQSIVQMNDKNNLIPTLSTQAQYINLFNFENRRLAFKLPRRLRPAPVPKRHYN
jgi:hypothetical protein